MTHEQTAQQIIDRMLDGTDGQELEDIVAILREVERETDEMKLSMVAARDKRIDDLERGTSIMGMKMCEYLARIESQKEEIKRLREVLGKIRDEILLPDMMDEVDIDKIHDLARSALNQKE